jgi:peptide subunit release factor RF-3
MKDEYGVDTTLDPLPYSIARWVPSYAFIQLASLST